MGPRPEAAGDDGFARFRRLMAFETSRAKGFYREAALLPTAEERPDLCAAEMMRAIYENILYRIEKRGYDVFGARVRVPIPVKLCLSLQAWWKCR